jgi:hypothetical protein
MASQVDKGVLWRVVPTTAAAKLIDQLAKNECRSVSSTIQLLLGEAVDRRALDDAIARAGLADAIKLLERAAIARNSAQIMAAEKPAAEAVDIEPRRYRKSTAEPASVES